MSSTYGDQTHILIEIKPRGPLVRSNSLKTIQGD